MRAAMLLVLLLVALARADVSGCGGFVELARSAHRDFCCVASYLLRGFKGKLDSTTNHETQVCEREVGLLSDQTRACICCWRRERYEINRQFHETFTSASPLSMRACFSLALGVL